VSVLGFRWPRAQIADPHLAAALLGDLGFPAITEEPNMQPFRRRALVPAWSTWSSQVRRRRPRSAARRSAGCC